METTKKTVKPRTGITEEEALMCKKIRMESILCEMVFKLDENTPDVVSQFDTWADQFTDYIWNDKIGSWIGNDVFNEGSIEAFGVGQPYYHLTLDVNDFYSITPYIVSGIECMDDVHMKYCIFKGDGSIEINSEIIKDSSKRWSVSDG